MPPCCQLLRIAVPGSVRIHIRRRRMSRLTQNRGRCVLRSSLLVVAILIASAGHAQLRVDPQRAAVVYDTPQLTVEDCRTADPSVRRRLRCKSPRDPGRRLRVRLRAGLLRGRGAGLRRRAECLPWRQPAPLRLLGLAVLRRLELAVLRLWIWLRLLLWLALLWLRLAVLRLCILGRWATGTTARHGHHDGDHGDWGHHDGGHAGHGSPAVAGAATRTMTAATSPRAGTLRWTTAATSPVRRRVRREPPHRRINSPAPTGSPVAHHCRQRRTTPQRAPAWARAPQPPRTRAPRRTIAAAPAQATRMAAATQRPTHATQTRHIG